MNSRECYTIKAVNPEGLENYYFKLEYSIQEELLALTNFQEQGDASYYYKKAFEKYLMPAEKYSKIIIEKKLRLGNLIDNLNYKNIESIPKEIDYIIQGSKKKEFSALFFFEQSAEKKMNVFFVFVGFSDIMLNLTKEAINTNNNERFLNLARSTYSFLNHFQLSYAGGATYAMKKKLELMKLIVNYYCTKQYNELCLKSIEYGSRYLFAYDIMTDDYNKCYFNYYSQYYKPVSESKLILLDSIIYLLFFNVYQEDSLFKMARYKKYREFQYEAIINLGVLKNLYWKPLIRTQAKTALEELEYDDDLFTSYMAKRAKRITLISLLRYIYWNRAISNYSEPHFLPPALIPDE